MPSDLLRETATWRRLEWHVAEFGDFHLREAFESDPTRGVRLAAEAAGVYLDYSKNLVTDDTLQLLRRLAHERGLEERIRGLVRGITTADDEVEGMLAFAHQVRAGDWLAGERVRTVVVLGAEPGPALAYDALRERATPEIAFRFVSSVDPVDLARATAGLDLRATLFVFSETHALPETSALAGAVRDRIVATRGQAAGAGRHVVAVSADPEDAAARLGIPLEQVFRPGAAGRLSSRSAAGLSTAIALGAEGVRELLAGLRAMDEHFARSPLGGNLPAIVGLLAVWYRSFLGAQSAAVVPYPTSLRLLPAYVRELSLGALGLHLQERGEPVETDARGAVLWGATGAEAQAAVLPFLHGTTALVPVDLVGVARSPEADAREQHDLLAGSLIAQAQLLATGLNAGELEDADVPEGPVSHRVLLGNRPTSALLLPELSPATLGALLALYEHSVFTQAAIWGIDPFDRWDAEPAEELAAKIASELSPGWKHELLHDSSTNALIERYRRLRDGA